MSAGLWLPLLRRAAPWLVPWLLVALLALACRHYATVATTRAQQLASACDLLLAVGSSLVVWPAAGIPLIAKRSGAKLVIINREPTEFDEFADLVVRNDIGDALAPFIRH